jgi:murein DD-endopeptidase MepM/ murein hydrolase activator NlpD
MAQILFPLRKRPAYSYKDGGREFGACRSGCSRLHAGCDLLAPKGTEVLAIDNGTVIQGPYHFYDVVYALEVKHDSGIVV